MLGCRPGGKCQGLMQQASSGVALVWLGHATCRLELDGVVLLTDPILGRWVGPLVRQGPAPAAESFSDADIVLISHPHHDHLDLASLRRLPPRVQVVAAPGTAGLVHTAGLQNVTELPVGESINVGPLTITAVAARHPGGRWRSDIAATAVGYLIQGSASVYFAGDTGMFPGLAELRGEVDLALVPIGGWGITLGPQHLDAAGAAQACALIRPRSAVPVHFGTFAIPGTRSALKPFWRRQDPGLFIREVALRSPETQPLTPAPGRRLILPSGKAQQWPMPRRPQRP